MPRCLLWKNDPFMRITFCSNPSPTRTTMPAPDVATKLLSRTTKPRLKQRLFEKFSKCVPSQITQPCCAAARQWRSMDNKVKLSAAGALEAADASMFKSLQREPTELNVLFLQKRTRRLYTSMWLKIHLRFSSFLNPSWVWLPVWSICHFSSALLFSSRIPSFLFLSLFSFVLSAAGSFDTLHFNVSFPLPPPLKTNSFSHFNTRRPLCRKEEKSFEFWKLNVMSFKVTLWLFPLSHSEREKVLIRESLLLSRYYSAPLIRTHPLFALIILLFRCL